MNLGDYMLYIWFGVIIALILIEVISKNLVATCFGISALISLIATCFTDNYVLQVFLFLVIGTLLIVFVRPNVIEIYKAKKDKKVIKKKSDNKKTKKSIKK